MSSVGDLNRRRQDRATGRRLQTRRQRLLLGGIAALLVVLLLGCGWLVWFSSVLTLKRVEISGLSLLTEAEVQAAAAAPMGRPLARVAEQPIAERVARLPQVQQVHVVRHWPNALRVEVTERQAAYAVSRNGRWLLVDTAGIGFISLSERPDTLLEARTKINQPGPLGELAQVTVTMPEDLLAEVERLEMPRPDAIKVVLRGGREVFYGAGSEAEVKGQVAAALARATKAKWIDVSAPGHPATR